MAAVASAAGTATKFSLQNDRRDIKDLWNDALKEYKGIVGRELQPTFKSTDDMIQHATSEKDSFSKWRHDGKTLDKLRGIFMQNIGFIEVGSQKLIAAATPAFPPAAAIGTALTFVLATCKGQSADYDVVTAFFEDMNNFLQRVTILEGRVPDYRAYQACLMDVFTALLMMCAFATKFIAKGRFKTWIINSFMGQDADLASARMRMDKNLLMLQSATEYAILSNTETLTGGQQELQAMQKELNDNQARQLELAQAQTLLLESVQLGQTAIQDGVDAVHADIQAILAMMSQKDDIATDALDEPTKVHNKIATMIEANEENDVRWRQLCETRVKGTGEWLFETPSWKAWLNNHDVNYLLLRGSRGSGKSCLAAGAHARLREIAEQDPGHFSVATYFFCDNATHRLKTFTSLISSVVLQISEQHPVLRSRFEQMFALKKEQCSYITFCENEYLRELLAPVFGKDSKYQLYIIIDNIDDSYLYTREGYLEIDNFLNMVETMNKLELRIKVMATYRSTGSQTVEVPLRSSIDKPTALRTVELGRAEVLPDIRALIAEKLKANSIVYGSLSHLRSKTQQKIIDHIEEKADTPLYVDFAFRYLGVIGRDGAILRELENGLPTQADTLFDRILSNCKRRLPQDLLPPTQLLLVWLTYSLESLNLDQANQIAQYTSQSKIIRIEEEIEPVFNRILQIGPTTKVSKKDRQFYPGKLSDTAILSDSEYNDGDLLVSLRDDFTKDFLSKTDIAYWDQSINRIQSGKAAHKYVNLCSASHRIIFLSCCQVLQSRWDGTDNLIPQKGVRELREYAVRYCLRHWQNIDCRTHKQEENLEVCRAFHELLAERHGFATMFEGLIDVEFRDVAKKSEDVFCEEGFTTFLQTWSSWAETITSFIKSSARKRQELGACSGNEEAMMLYWTGSSDTALQPLFEAHMRNWLDGSNDKQSAINAFESALNIHEQVSNVYS